MIKGKITVKPYPCPETLRVGETGYIDSLDVYLYKNMCYVDKYAYLRTTVDPEEEEENDLIFIPITRIGEGLTEDDFELNFEDVKKPLFLSTENDKVFIEDETSDFIIFNIAEHIVISDDYQNTIESEIQRLTRLKEKAVQEQKFEKAAEIEEKLKKLTNSTP